MYKLFLSFRYFRSRLINIIPVVCMTLGVMALIVILAVMDGFQAQLRATLRGALSDIIIRVDYESDFEKWEQVLAGMDEVQAYSPHLLSYVLVARAETNGSSVRRRAAEMGPSVVLGIDYAREAEVSAFREYLKRRSPGSSSDTWMDTTVDPNPFLVLDERMKAIIFTDETQTEIAYELCDVSGVVLGRPLAAMLGVHRPLGYEDPEGRVRYQYSLVNLTTAVRGRQEDGKETFSAQQITCPVTGIYESGNQEIDQRIAYMDRRVAKSIFGIKRDPQEIRLELANYATDQAKVKDELYQRRGEIFELTKAHRTMRFEDHQAPYFVQSWEDRRRNFLNAINNEKGLIAIIAGMAFIVTGFMIFSILSMIVTMKTRDIGILKALGGTTRGVLWIFILNGLIVGVIGAGAGLGLGLLFIDNINEIKDFLNDVFGWEPFPQNIYLFAEIPTRVIPSEVAIVTGMALVVALLGAFLPALRAARLDPVESLRYE